MKALVCGGRNLRDEAMVFERLDELQRWTVQDAERALGIAFACAWERHGPISCVVTGAASGADYLAEKWAKAREIAYRGHPAPWHTHGAWCRCFTRETDKLAHDHPLRHPAICKAAGPWRNAEMLRRENVPSFPVGLVIAFPGGVGTSSMVTLARAAGIVVLEVPK